MSTKLDQEKYCIKCEHQSLIDGIRTCLRPVGEIDVVHGVQRPNNIPCSRERSRFSGLLSGCGPKGKFWELKLGLRN